MAGAALSFAQSFRVIGQDLEGRGVHSFELGKFKEEYIVEMDRGGRGGKSRDKTILKRITEKIHGVDDSQISNSLRFTSAKLFWADAQRRLQRSDSRGLPNAGKLSLVLRVLGDFLDEKGRRRLRHFLVQRFDTRQL
jgi:hypothetical protein